MISPATSLDSDSEAILYPPDFRPVREWLQSRLLETRLEGANVEDCFVRMMAQSVVRRALSIVRGRGHGGMLIFLPDESPDIGWSQTQPCQRDLGELPDHGRSRSL